MISKNLKSNKWKNAKAQFGAALGLTLSLGLTLTGAEAEEGSVFTLEDYEVLGKYLYVDQLHSIKTPVPISKVPQSASIITAEQIELQGFESLGDLVDYTPG